MFKNQFFKSQSTLVLCVVSGCCTLFGVTQTAAQQEAADAVSEMTARTVIEKYLVAIGGQDKLRAVPSIIMERKLERDMFPGAMSQGLVIGPVEPGQEFDLGEVELKSRESQRWRR